MRILFLSVFWKFLFITQHPLNSSNNALWNKGNRLCKILSVLTQLKKNKLVNIPTVAFVVNRALL